MTTGFSSNPELLKKLLDGIHEGRTALPSSSVTGAGTRTASSACSHRSLRVSQSAQS